MIRAEFAAVAILAATSVLAGCGGAAHDPAPSTAAASVSSPSPAASPTETPGTTGVSNGKNYSVTTTSIQGSTPDDAGKWDAQFSELSGGDSAVAEAFNNASRTKAQEQIDHMKDVAEPGSEWNFESQGQVTFRSIAIGQIIVGTSHYGAVPTNDPSAVVIDSRNAQPVTLADLFTDEQAGLQRLSEQTKAIMKEKYHLDDATLSQPGYGPTPDNFANWIPTAEGMEIHFAPYQFGIRMTETITVPWAKLSDVLAPDYAAIAEG